MKFKVSNQTLNNSKQKTGGFAGQVSGCRWDADWQRRTTLTPSPAGVSSPSCRHANTHFNHLDFHYHGFLFSLLKPPLLATEPRTKINSLSCLRHQIGILVGFEFSFQTQTFDVCYIFSHKLSHKEGKWPRLIRILSQEETRDRMWQTCCCEIRIKLQTGSVSQWQFHPDMKVQLRWSCIAGCQSHKHVPYCFNTVCDYVHLSPSSPPSPLRHLKGKTNKQCHTSIICQRAHVSCADTYIMRSGCTRSNSSFSDETSIKWSAARAVRV